MKKVIGSVLALGVLTSCSSSSTTRISAAGATFPAPLYQSWVTTLAQSGGPLVNYQAVGSGAGVRQFNAGTVDFGASDKAVGDDNEIPIVQIPMTGGAIVPAYNNPGCDLRLTQTQLSDIYLGNINTWEEVGCDGGNITVVYRSDGSGTTAGWTASLSAFSPEWADTVGSGKAVNWPTGIGAKGNSGVAAQINQVEGSIGYLNYGYVSNSDTIKQAWIQNKDGNYVQANAETSEEGLSRIVLDDQLRGSNPNPSGANSYPIVSLTWVLAHPEHEKNDTIKEVFTFMLSEESQSTSDSLGYVPLPESIRLQALEVVSTLKTPI
jgi:phosphate transport system substrate-binding protein